eukprot:7501898-Pyramimonas_sp.AAC.1
MEFTVSRKKCQIVASSSKLAQDLGTNLRSLNFKVCLSVKNLGHDFSQQVRKGKRVLKGRVNNLRKRSHRFRALRHHRRGLSRVFRAGGLASASYGVRVCGMNDTDLSNLRAASAFALFGKAKGRSRPVQYLLHDPPDLDP